MPEREGPKVVLRGPAEGESIILPMGRQRARITRKASRTETGGHWAIGEASQDPGFDNPPHTHDEAEAFYVLEGSYTFYTGTAPAEGVGPSTFVFIPPGAVHGFRTVQKAGGYFAFGRPTVLPNAAGPVSHRSLRRFSCLQPYGRRPSGVPLRVHLARRRGTAAPARSDVYR